VGENILVEGKPRMGWFIDGNPDTPEIAVMLQDTGKQIVLTVPTKGMGSHRGDPYYRWFMAGAHFGDDPDRTKYSYKPPRVAMFEDNDGPVILVGCRAVGIRSNLGAGSGMIVPNFAVLGGRHLKYDKINGLRSELPGLAIWSGQRSVHAKPEPDAEGRVQKVEVSLSSPPQVRLARRMNLMLRPTWRTSYPDNIGTFAAHDVVELETTSKRPRPWEDHLEGHIAMRDLLVVAAWRHFGFLRLTVNRTDDPERVLSGDARGPRWAAVATHMLRKHEAWTQTPRFLFTFHDIGPVGVRRWLTMRSHFARAMQPLVGIADQKDAFWETRMVQSGLALEALGYQLEVDRGGDNRDTWGQLSYMKALEVVLDDMSYVPLDDPADWKQRSRDCYMGVKHADNRLPDSLVLANTLRENLLVLRVWLASRLGCSKAALEQRINLDPLANEYVLLD
jgi:hypothetical protein